MASYRGGPEAAQGLIRLLKDEALQEAFVSWGICLSTQHPQVELSQHSQQTTLNILINFRYIYTTKKRKSKRQAAPEPPGLRSATVVGDDAVRAFVHEPWGGQTCAGHQLCKAGEVRGRPSAPRGAAVAMLRCWCTWQREPPPLTCICCVRGGTGSCPQILVTKCVSHGKILKDSSPLWNFPRQIWYLCAKGQVDMQWRNRNRKLEHICSRYIQNSW